MYQENESVDLGTHVVGTRRGTQGSVVNSWAGTVSHAAEALPPAARHLGPERLFRRHRFLANGSGGGGKAASCGGDGFRRPAAGMATRRRGRRT